MVGGFYRYIADLEDQKKKNCLYTNKKDNWESKRCGNYFLYISIKLNQ